MTDCLNMMNAWNVSVDFTMMNFPTFAFVYAMYFLMNGYVYVEFL